MSSPRPSPNTFSGTRSQSTSSLPQKQQTRQQYSCASCKKRKVRCDRSDPCAGCIAAGVECITTTRALYHRRKRTNTEPEKNQQRHSPEVQHNFNTPNFETTLKSGVTSIKAKMDEKAADQAPTFGQDLWTGLNEFRDPRTSNVTNHSNDEARQSTSTASPSSDPTTFIFASIPSDFNLRDSQPSPVHAFVLWQAFLQNVNPLSKLIYTSQVEDELLEATRDFGAISKESTALLFSIYAAAVSSMKDAECQSTLGLSRETLLARYITSTQQALVAAGFLNSLQLVVLQAYVIYLLSARQIYDPHAIWLLTGIAVRMGERIKLSDERESFRFSLSEIQIRRRVWWQILLIDSRSGQLSGTQTQLSTSTHTFPLPANLNDADINANMKEMPVIHNGPTEMIFCLLRYEFGKFLIEHGKKLNSSHVSLERKDQLIDELENYLECNFLRYCDPAIPLHLLSVGGARSGVCKLRLMVHHPSQYPDKGASMPQSERDMLFLTSLRMVEYDVLGKSTKTLGNFSWHLNFYFQLDAFVFMLIELNNQLSGPLADKAWQTISEVYNYRLKLLEDTTNDLYVAVGELTIRVWEARARDFESRHREALLTPPFIQKLLSRRVNRLNISPDAIHQPSSSVSKDVEQQSTAELGFGLTSGPIIQNPSYENEIDCSGTAQFYGIPADEVGLDWESMDWVYWNNLLNGNAA